MITPDGLIDQLLGITVESEEPELQKEKNKLLVRSLSNVHPIALSIHVLALNIHNVALSIHTIALNILMRARLLSFFQFQMTSDESSVIEGAANAKALKDVEDRIIE
eukprot:2188488-Pyramimonas_sp.AAC.1